MAKIVKSKLPPQVVIPDTSALWHKDKGPAVSPDFDTFWKEYSSAIELQLYLPRPVREELCFQQCSSASKSFERALLALNEISAVSARKHTTRSSKAKIYDQVGTKLDRWLKLKKGKLIEIHYDKVDWEQLCKSAMWRLPPFSCDSKDIENEKGFKDCLILESVVCHVKGDSRHVHFAFICGDQLLRNAVAERLKLEPRFSAFESLEHFGSHIKLTRQKLTQEFINNILNRAREKFYSAGDANCLYFKKQIRDQIQREHKDKLIPPEESANPLLALFETSPTSNPYQEMSPAVWWIIRPEFAGVEGERHYHWKSIVTVVHPFKKLPMASVTNVLEPDNKVLFVRFAVFWKARVKADGRFYEVDIEKMDFVSQEFKQPTEEEVKRFALAKLLGAQ